MTLKPDSVLITGANRGIGLEFVKQLLTLPHPPRHVFAGCRSPDTAKDFKHLSSKYDFLTLIRLDVNDESTISQAKDVIEEMVGEAGLTLLINNAGVAKGIKDESLQMVTSQSMADVFRTNAIGTLMVVKTFLPLLQQAASTNNSGGCSINRAAIINISSAAGSISENSLGGGYAYRSSKVAQNMITKSLSIDLRSDGILVAALHPGWVQTDMGGSHAKESASSSVAKMINVMGNLHGEEMNGKLYNNSGHVIPW